ncbi:MAG: transcription termination/antitermination protein NusA [Gammaproteobacteria bacterium]|nr:transcription termination/antitermination protein NusA [Gammaproteobacteria bacterium]
MSKDILLVVDSVSNEKSLTKEVIFTAIELAIASITERRYHPDEVAIRVTIDRDSGDYETFRQWTVMPDSDGEDLEFPAKEIVLSEAKKLDSELEVGDIVEEAVESIDFGRIAAQQAKQVILREIRQAERNETARQYKEQIGALVNGTAKRVTRENVILDMGDNTEAIILREDLIAHEAIRIGDRVRGVLTEVSDERRGPQLVMSRATSQMLIELFKVEVPEIGEEVIEIKAAARDPGSRAKIAVKTNDGRIDPIGACVGIRGSRVQAVSNELNGERVDIVLWDDDPAQLVVNAMAPAEIASIVVDEETHGMDIAVREDQLAQAIGRGGQNVQLASKLSGWMLNVMTEAEAELKSKDKSSNLQQLFMENLDIDEGFAEILIREGFSDLESIAYAPVEEMLSIDGFNQDVVEELRNRARNILLSQVLSDKNKVGEVEPAEDLLDLEGMTRHLAYVLASRGIVTREDLAEQSVDELADVEDLSPEQAADLIMKARAHWFA